MEERKDMILFEDKDIIVCHKTAGIPVQSARLGQKDMVSILNNHLAEQTQKMTDFVHVVHRLDQPVEGVIVFAKNAKAAANLTKQIQQNKVKKIYQAVCCSVDKSTKNENISEKCGKLSRNKEESGKTKKVRLEDFLVKDGRTNASRVTAQNEKDAKKAVLEYEILAQKEQYALVQINLQTGRHHQIRVQMSHAGMPLYGDQKYHENWQEFVIPEENNGLALCAVSYSFKHPSTGRTMKFEVQPNNPVFGIFRENEG